MHVARRCLRALEFAVDVEAYLIWLPIHSISVVAVRKSSSLAVDLSVLLPWNVGRLVCRMYRAVNTIIIAAIVLDDVELLPAGRI